QLLSSLLLIAGLTGLSGLAPPPASAAPYSASYIPYYYIPYSRYSSYVPYSYVPYSYVPYSTYSVAYPVVPNYAFNYPTFSGSPDLYNPPTAEYPTAEYPTVNYPTVYNYPGFYNDS